MSYISPEKLKTVLIEFKNNIIDKFYNKSEVDDKINQNIIDMNSIISQNVSDLNNEVDQKLTDLTNTVNETVDTLNTDVDKKISDYTASIDGVVKQKIDDYTNQGGIITTDNMSDNNIAVTTDLPTIMTDEDYQQLLNGFK